MLNVECYAMLAVYLFEQVEVLKLLTEVECCLIKLNAALQSLFLAGMEHHIREVQPYPDPAPLP